MEVTKRKISKSEPKKLYNELIQKDIDAREREKIDEKREKIDGIRKYNILIILKNIDLIFTGAYLHYKHVPKETMFQGSIAEKITWRSERLDEIKRKEQNINDELFNAYFTDYQNPSGMYKKLSETKRTVNEVREDSIKKVLGKLKRIIEYAPIDDAFKIEENEQMIDVIEKILEFNNKIQSGHGLKILTPSQMLSRLPISLAQWNAGNNSEKNQKRN